MVPWLQQAVRILTTEWVGQKERDAQNDDDFEDDDDDDDELESEEIQIGIVHILIYYIL